MALFRRKSTMPAADCGSSRTQHAAEGAGNTLRQWAPHRAAVPGGAARGSVCSRLLLGRGELFWQLPGVYSTAVGYAGGFTPNPTYEEFVPGYRPRRGGARHLRPAEDLLPGAARGRSGSLHDPTQGMRQGNDVGTQYRSAIYALDEEQRKAARRNQSVSIRPASPRRAAARSPPRSSMRRSSTMPRTITSSTWRRIPTDTAGLEGVGCRSNPRSYRWARRRRLMESLRFLRGDTGL